MSVTCVLDPDICIDILRNHPPALKWLSNVDPDGIGIPVFVALELLQNCKDKREANASILFIGQFVLLIPDQAAMRWALDNYSDIHVAHGIGMVDMLIASTAESLNVPLFSFNKRHYRNIPRVALIEPYVR